MQPLISLILEINIAYQYTGKRGEKRVRMEKSREKIILALKKNSTGFTISELSKKLNLSRQTVANCFAFLEGAEKVNIRKVGMAKIYYWSEK
jgi:predicted transcriptional regulator